MKVNRPSLRFCCSPEKSSHLYRIKEQKENNPLLVAQTWEQGGRRGRSAYKVFSWVTGVLWWCGTILWLDLCLQIRNSAWQGLSIVSWHHWARKEADWSCKSMSKARNVGDAYCIEGPPKEADFLCTTALQVQHAISTAQLWLLQPFP